MRVILSAFFWVYMAVSLMAFWFAVVIPWGIITLFDRRRVFSHWYAYTWACHYIRISPFWRVEVEGVEKIDESVPYVMVANHQSIADIMVLFTLRKQFRWVAKDTVFKVPFLGWMMRMADYVPIKRGDRKSREEMMDHCKRHLRMGNPIMMFPEGTRSETTEMRSFKRGAFRLAVDEHAPVLPIIIDGTHNALPKNTWIFHQTGKLTIRIRVLDPLEPAEFEDDVGRLMHGTRELMVEELAAMRAERDRPDGERLLPMGKLREQAKERAAKRRERWAKLRARTGRTGPNPVADDGLDAELEALARDVDDDDADKTGTE